MWQVLPLELIIGFFVGTGLLAFAIVWRLTGAPHFWRRSTNRFSGIPRMVSLAITITVVTTIIVGKWLWSPIAQIPGFGEHYYPDISGIWEGYVHSNWINPETGKTLEPIPLKVEIKQNFFSIQMHLISKNRYTESHTVIAWPQSNSELGIHRLWYLFISHVRSPNPDDSSSHEGAAVLNLTKVNDSIELQGTYWTNRNWWKNKNTAGSINLKRSKG